MLLTTTKSCKRGINAWNSQLDQKNIKKRKRCGPRKARPRDEIEVQKLVKGVKVISEGTDVWKPVTP
jgi:hypothetical protein